jgi:pimeloyl-ACP methyl ester carboxylesterase
VAYFPYEIREDLDRLGYEHSMVPTSLGRLRLARARGGDAPHTLFLHGVALDSSAWSPLIDAAAGDPRAAGWAFLDLPGFGGSDPLEHAVSLDEVAKVVVEVLDALGAERVDLVGHSMGGFLALHLAAEHPERVSSLAVLCGAYGTIVDVVNAPIRTLVRAPGTSLIYLGLTGLARIGRVGDTLLRVAARTGLLRLTLVGVAAHPLRVPGSMLRAMAAGNRPRSFLYAQATGIGYDYRAVWSRITAPVLAVFGASDGLVSRRDADALASALPAARIAYVDEAGHLAPMEQPEVVLRLVLQSR